MRQGQQNRRGRGRNNNSNTSSNNNNGGRKPQNPLTRNFESSGPDVKIRGTAVQIAEKYSTLARDAASSGDIVMAENYLQHAEHYNRIIMAAQQAQIATSAQPVGHHGHGGHGLENGHALNGPQRIVSEQPNGAVHEQPQPEINFSPKAAPAPKAPAVPKAPAAAPVVKEEAAEKAAPIEAPAPVSAAPNEDGDAATPAAEPEAEKPRRRRRYTATGTTGARGAKASAANGKDLSNGSAADGLSGDHSADEAIV